MYKRQVVDFPAPGTLFGAVGRVFGIPSGTLEAGKMDDEAVHQLAAETMRWRLEVGAQILAAVRDDVEIVRIGQRILLRNPKTAKLVTAEEWMRSNMPGEIGIINHEPSNLQKLAAGTPIARWTPASSWNQRDLPLMALDTTVRGSPEVRDMLGYDSAASTIYLNHGIRPLMATSHLHNIIDSEWGYGIQTARAAAAVRGRLTGVARVLASRAPLRRPMK